MRVILTNLLEMSLTGSVVILAVMLVRLLLRRCPKIYSYVLWAVVAFRLCIPVSFESDLSIFNLFGKIETPSIADTIPVQHLTATTEPVADYYALVCCVWLCGALILVIYSIFTYYRLQYKLRVSFPMFGNVYGVDELKSPFVLGFMDPKIYIPLGLDRDTENYILMHERIHIKRGDHFIKLFAFAVLCAHWFNPLCWLAFIMMSRDMEMSCDEKVLKSGDISCPYSTALLSFAANKRFPSPGPLCFGEVSVKRRIKNILSWKKPALWLTVISVIICAIAFTVCACNPVEQDNYEAREIIAENAECIDYGDTTADSSEIDGTDTVDTTVPDTATDFTSVTETEVTDTVTQKITSISTSQKANAYIPPDTTKAVTRVETTAPETEFTSTETQAPVTQPQVTQPDATAAETQNNYSDGAELVEGIMKIWNAEDEDDWWEYERIIGD